MKVYVLFHADIEDDRYVRGVYARREDAEADVAKDEMPRRSHHDACCSVDEMEVLTQPVGLEPLPPMYGPPAPLSPLMQAFLDQTWAFATAPIPYVSFARIRAGVKK